MKPKETAETIEEIRFYLEHGMPEQASAALEKLRTLTSDQAILSKLQAEVEGAAQPAPEEASSTEAVSELTVEEIPPAAEEEPAIEAVEAEAEVEAEVEVEAVAEIEVEAEIEVAPETPAPVAETKAAPKSLSKPPAAKPPAAKPPVPEAPVEPAPGVLQEFVSDLESSLGENFLPGTVSHEAEPAVAHASAKASEPKHKIEPAENQPELEPIGNSAPTTFGVPQAEPMGEFVADLEASLGDDFLKGAPVAEPEPAPPVQPVSKIQAPVAAAPPRPVPTQAPSVSAPVASAAAAAASAGTPAVSSQATAPVAQPPAPKPPISPIVPSAPAAAKSSPFGEDAGVDLAEMFGELKHDLEVGASTTEEDPETHYNLGIAFREMGLLDEAIGELQKTCQAVDRGHPFPQVMQTYTWLAQCFLDKGMPEAAIRWYDKALQAPSIDEETRTALHYELAAAYETAGDKPSALKHFMEVYGRNIDYRDVAERIKPLKS